MNFNTIFEKKTTLQQSHRTHQFLVNRKIFQLIHADFFESDFVKFSPSSKR